MSVSRKKLAIKAQLNQSKSVVLTKAELTVAEAASALNVSCAYVISLLNQNIISYHKVGRSYRLFHQDVVRYKTIDDKKRLKVLAILSKQAQILGMGY